MRFFSTIKYCHLIILLFCCSSKINAQNCPENIDFEQGSFMNWQCYNGSITTGGISLAPASVTTNRHTLIPRASNVGVKDYYGNFPVNSPNGSAYSVKLGNTTGGHEAEGISYQFTIPANRNTYSLLYQYAVVFQSPNHQINEQPRFEIEVKNETDNQVVNCSSFTFIPGTSLPGFFVSAADDSVLCKDWTPVTINLNNKAGKTIKITFKTGDCTFQKHFGYAYVDVNTDCNAEFAGASYCHDDTAVNVIGPPGFAGYQWYNASFTQLLGNAQNLHLQPPPPTGTNLAVVVTPYNGYGCVDTMYAVMQDTLTYRANAGANALLCGLQSSIILGESPKGTFNYHWSPGGNLSDSAIANPVATPAVTTQYILNVQNGGGGCISADTVVITKSIVDTSMQFLGKNEFCKTSSDSAVFLVNPQNNVQWFKNFSPLNGANNNFYKAIQSGSYFATLKNADGCIDNTRTEQIFIETPPTGVTYPLVYALKNDPIQLAARNFWGLQLWLPATYLDNAQLLQPIFNSPIENNLTYSIKITTKAGCTVTDFQPIKVIPEITVFVPNAFTPNGDFKNDYFVPLTAGAIVTLFKVYNRFGVQVFSIEENEKGWDGKYKGLPQNLGTYVWYAEAIGINKKIVTRKGTVILIR
jgi:gliding motility-associated-like protein